VDGMRAAFPTSGERNYRVTDAAAIRDRVLAHFTPAGPEIDRLDGLSIAFPDWRLNLRSSSTEPLLRLNIETRGDRALLAEKLAEVEALIGA
ncbi:MAG: phosphomannomutase, partial [Rhodobacteraceae bacterium]|nr:phosphomannomutase [Paracoccaceae bacterium]